MPRASLRSVLLICAFSTARICRVSTQITGKSASASARSSFQSNPLEAISRVPQYRQQSLRFARDPHFSLDPARVIHNADARVLDRNVQSRKIIHAALLLLMLEAAHADLVSPSA